tara:strand:- start:34 stop:171 length:138 start_codon:yes stop_codon:yes gene_type:complete
MEAKKLHYSLPGAGENYDQSSDKKCMTPITRRIKNSANGTQLKNK